VNELDTERLWSYLLDGLQHGITTRHDYIDQKHHTTRVEGR